MKKVRIVKKGGRATGFALIEIPTEAILKGESIVGYGAAESWAVGRAGLLNAIRQLGESGNIGPLTGPGTQMLWPANTFITKVMPIRRLFGLSATRVFHVFVELEAPGRSKLIEAFRYLDHFCGVEGYGGGG